MVKLEHGEGFFKASDLNPAGNVDKVFAAFGNPHEKKLPPKDLGKDD